MLVLHNCNSNEEKFIWLIESSNADLRKQFLKNDYEELEETYLGCKWMEKVDRILALTNNEKK